MLSQLFDDFIRRRFERVDSQIQRRTLLHGFKQSFVVGVLNHGFVVEPFRHFGLNFFRSLGILRSKHILQRFLFASEGGIRNAVDAVLQREREQPGELRCFSRANGRHTPSDHREMTHRVVNGFGNNGSFARTEMTSVFEIKTHQDVCRSVELQNFAKSLCEFVHNQRSNANFAVVRALHSRIRRLLRIMRSSFFRRHTSQTFFGCTLTIRQMTLGRFPASARASGPASIRFRFQFITPCGRAVQPRIASS